MWRSDQTEPIQLVAGGSGIVPLMAMIRSRGSAGSSAPFRLLYSVREPGAIFTGMNYRRYQIRSTQWLSSTHTRARLRKIRRARRTNRRNANRERYLALEPWPNQLCLRPNIIR